jgi:hypothetical protein
MWFLYQPPSRDKRKPVEKPSVTLLFIFEADQRRRKKTQRSRHTTNIWPRVPPGPDARSDRAGWLPAVSFCSALLCSKEQSVQSNMKGSVIKGAVQLSNEVVESSKRKQSSEAAQWLVTSGVASSRRKIYQLEVLQMPSGIIVISVITVGNAVQIKRSRLSSVYLNYVSRIPGHAASWCQNNQ